MSLMTGLKSRRDENSRNFPSSLNAGSVAEYQPSVTANFRPLASEYSHTLASEPSSGRDQAIHSLSGDQAYWRISDAAAVSTRVTAFVSTATNRRRWSRSAQSSFLLSGDHVGLK